MKRRYYKPVQRQPKRIYARSMRNPKRRKRFFFFCLILIFLIVIFVPGHNGLITLTAKRLKIQKLKNEIENLKIKIELVRAKIDKTKDPEYIRRYAYDRYRMVPKTNTLKYKTPQAP